VDTMIIKAGINEVDIGKIRTGQPVRVTLDAYPKVRFAGTIDRIAPAARLEDKVKVFDVEIGIDRQGAELRTGMTANVDVVGEKRQGVLTVPVEAIFKKDDAEIVYVRKTVEPEATAAKGGFLASVFAAGKSEKPSAGTPDEKDLWKKSFEARQIETGLASIDKVQVVKGLEAGTEVAVEDPTRPKKKDERD
jgi:HlyD family secretion protein